MKQLLSLLLTACLLFSFSACGDSAQKPASSSSAEGVADTQEVLVVKPIVSEPEPEMALDKIYESVEIEDVKELNLRVLTEEFGFDFTQYALEDCAGRYTSGRFGLANVFILKPSKKLPSTAKAASSSGTSSALPQTPMNLVRDQLQTAKANLTIQTASYDIYDSHDIAQNAQIFEQGGYVIMLMLEDNEAARQIIDLYIPKT